MSHTLKPLSAEPWTTPYTMPHIPAPVVLCDPQVPDVDSIILGTGYHTSLPFVPHGLLEGCDFGDPFLPLPLHRNTFHPNLPGAAFVGMYFGPYFAIMELQAVSAGGLRPDYFALDE